MMQVWGLTDIGLVRRDNQDAYAAEYHQPTDHLVCVVCDGMGGIRGGHLASRIAVDTYMEEMKKILRRDMTPSQLRQASAYAVALANDAVYEKAQELEEYRGMGTTLVAAVSFDSGVVVSNVGDSRAYHISPEGIRRITRDHSLVEDLVTRGDITEEEARVHPNRNVITRALGPEKTEECDGYICDLKQGEYILLCSDGLVNTVSDQEILYEVIHNGDTEGCLNRLLAISKSRGAADNVTAVLMRMD
ncbi:MAG: Stp1/IreP family PP2C-type Ser/Thr phosphatase [Oscillospiraceae bacterium]